MKENEFKLVSCTMSPRPSSDQLQPCMRKRNLLIHLKEAANTVGMQAPFEFVVIGKVWNMD